MIWRLRSALLTKTVGSHTNSIGRWSARDLVTLAKELRCLAVEARNIFACHVKQGDDVMVANPVTSFWGNAELYWEHVHVANCAGRGCCCTVGTNRTNKCNYVSHVATRHCAQWLYQWATFVGQRKNGMPNGRWRLKSCNYLQAKGILQHTYQVWGMHTPVPDVPYSCQLP